MKAETEIWAAEGSTVFLAPTLFLLFPSSLTPPTTPKKHHNVVSCQQEISIVIFLSPLFLLQRNIHKRKKDIRLNTKYDSRGCQMMREGGLTCSWGSPWRSSTRREQNKRAEGRRQKGEKRRMSYVTTNNDTQPDKRFLTQHHKKTTEARERGRRRVRGRGRGSRWKRPP